MNYASSRMAYDGTTGQANVDLNRDLIYLGPFESDVHFANPDRAPARETDIPRADAPRAEPSRQAPLRQAEQPSLTGKPWLPHKLPNGAQMLRSMDGSTFVMLADGTMWEVYLPHRPQAETWRPGDLIQIRQASVVTGDFDYQLVNGVARSTVSARFAGWVEMKEGDATEGQAPRQ